MAVHRINRIITERGDTLEHYGWYGSCTTAAATQAKYVTIPGFTSTSLADGVRVVVRFNYGQTYNGMPTLNVSGTGAKNIYTRTSGGPAGRYEWEAGQIVPFVYYNGTWNIEDGTHASTTIYGKTRLSDVALDYRNDVAATPESGMGRLNLIAVSSVWGGNDAVVSLLSASTPAASGWLDEGGYSRCELPITEQQAQAMEDALNQNPSSMRAIKVTYRDVSFFRFYDIQTDADLYYEGYDQTSGVGIVLSYTELVITVNPGDGGAYPVKIELYTGGAANIMTYPLMEQYMKSNGYLTLADLPVYDGSVT